jgi:hypothetical protein
LNMNGDTITKGNDNIIVKDVSGSTVNVYTQPPTEQLDTKISVSKFPEKLPHFTNQIKTLEALHSTLQKHKKASLSGTHGIGKTSIAIEYLYKYESCYKHLIFIDADEANLISQMGKIASKVNPDLTGNMDDDYKALELCHWLNNNENCIVVFDNAENISDYSQYIPQNAKSFVLVTSNEKIAANKWQEVSICEWENMHLELLLYRRATKTHNTEYEQIPEEQICYIKEICNLLDYFPLGINIAASLIEAEEIFFETYLDYLRNNPESILTEPNIDNERTPKSIEKSFSISFERIKKYNENSDMYEEVPKLAEMCLKVSAFLSYIDIPKESFIEFAKKYSEESNKKEEREIWKKVFKKLLSYNLFKTTSGKDDSLFTYPSLQKVMRNKIRNESNSIVEPLIDTFDQLFLEPTIENKSKCEKYESHLRAFVRIMKKDEDFYNKLDDIYVQKLSLLYKKLEKFEDLFKKEQSESISISNKTQEISTISEIK